MSTEAETQAQPRRAASSANTSIDVFVPYHQAAWELLSRGVRPTADMLVQKVGGQKQSAVAGLRSFWADYVPNVIGGRGAGSAPDAVLEMSGRLWALANDMALADAERTLAQRTERVEWREKKAKERTEEQDAREKSLVDRETAVATAGQAERKLLERLQRDEARLTADLALAVSKQSSLDATLLSERAAHALTKDALHTAALELAAATHARHLTKEKWKATGETLLVAQAEATRERATRLGAEATIKELSAALSKMPEEIEAVRLEERKQLGIALAALEAAHAALVSEMKGMHHEAEQSLQVQLLNCKDERATSERKLQQRIDRLERGRSGKTKAEGDAP